VRDFFLVSDIPPIVARINGEDELPNPGGVGVGFQDTGTGKWHRNLISDCYTPVI
jgi:hypothetical protein